MSDLLRQAQEYDTSVYVGALLLVSYTTYRVMGGHKSPLMQLFNHACTCATAMALASLAALVSSLGSTPAAPTDCTNITPEWVTYMLRSKGLLTAEQNAVSLKVTEFEAGKTGRCGRVEIEFDSKAVKAPPSIVVKMSRADFHGRLINLAISLHREASFFSEMAAESPMTIPKCMYSSVSGFSKAFLMVLEDISPAEDILLADAGRVAFGDPENMNEEHGCAIEMCERMTDMVTLQHAKYYNDPGLKAKAWLLGAQMRQADGKDTAEYDLAYFFCSSNWDKTKVHLQKGTWKGTKGWDPALIAAIDDLRDLLIDSDQGQESELWDYTLVHGDYHGANILTRTGGDTSGEVVLDFQVLQLAESVSDLGKFLALVLGPKLRRLHEERLVRKSYDAMLKTGKMSAATMPFELYYLRYKVHGGITLMLLLMLLDTLMADGKTEQDEYMVMYLYSRCQNFCKDHGYPAENMVKSTKMRQKLLGLSETGKRKQ